MKIDEEMPRVDNPFLRIANIPHAKDVQDPSEISLHLLVKNGASVVGRLLDNVGPYVHELVAVLNDCEDDTESILADKCAELNLSFIPVHVTRKTHPEFYILDTKRTYEVGRSLNGEDFHGPFTEEPILAEWAAARNAGWNACTKKWRLFLDSDDIVLDPECIPGLVKLLEKEGVELLVSPYHFHVDAQERPRGKSMRERIALNKPVIRWVNPIHEVIAGSSRVAHNQTNLIVRDMRDNQGKSIRIPGRNFKILYHRARANDWDVSPRLLADLIMEIRPMSGAPAMLKLADDLLEKYMMDASWPEERGWVLAITGEMHEGHGHIEKAIELYKESLEIHPGSKTAWRLCRALFKRAAAMSEARSPSVGLLTTLPEQNTTSEKEEIYKLDELDASAEHDDVSESAAADKATALEGAWRDVVAAYKLGIAHKVVHQVLDDGPLHEEMEKIHVAGALIELGDFAEAKKFIDGAAVSFPESSPIAFMKKKIDEAITHRKLEALPQVY
jgi:glycosyltransferase involved in cell wall biosynthesis